MSCSKRRLNDYGEDDDHDDEKRISDDMMLMERNGE